MEEKYMVYLFVNRSLQEIFFGMAAGTGADAELPGEICHWDFTAHAITAPVIIEENLSRVPAEALILELQEKALCDPQGKKLLKNLSVSAVSE